MQGIINLGNLYAKTHQSGAVYSSDGICPSLCGGCHSYGIPFTIIKRRMECENAQKLKD